MKLISFRTGLDSDFNMPPDNFSTHYAKQLKFYSKYIYKTEATKCKAL